MGKNPAVIRDIKHVTPVAMQRIERKNEQVRWLADGWAQELCTGLEETRFVRRGSKSSRSGANQCETRPAQAVATASRREPGSSSEGEGEGCSRTARRLSPGTWCGSCPE
jgi:hypothetical protein